LHTPRAGSRPGAPRRPGRSGGANWEKPRISHKLASFRMSKESGGAPPELQELRQKIDEVDEGIVRLIAKRLEMVGLVIKEKSGRPQPIRDPARERAVLARVEGVAQSLGVSGPLARKIFAEIITHSLAREAASLSASGNGREVAIAYQGSPSTYNQLAAEKYA